MRPSTSVSTCLPDSRSRTLGTGSPGRNYFYRSELMQHRLTLGRGCLREERHPWNSTIRSGGKSTKGRTLHVYGGKLAVLDPVEGQREGRGCVAPRAVRKIKFGEKGPHRECHIFITVAHFV